MLTHAIGGLLPASVGVALSPIPIIAVTLILATPRAARNGAAFALAWVIGLAAVSMLVLTVMRSAADPDSDVSRALHVVEVMIGGLFLVMALGQWRARPRAGAPAQPPAWMSRVDGFGASQSFGFGLLCATVNPKNIAFTATGVAAVVRASLSAAQTATATAVFVAIGSLSVVGPVVYHLIRGDQAARRLAAIRSYFVTNQTAILMVLFLLLGAKILGDGIAGL